MTPNIKVERMWQYIKANVTKKENYSCTGSYFFCYCHIPFSVLWHDAGIQLDLLSYSHVSESACHVGVCGY